MKSCRICKVLFLVNDEDRAFYSKISVPEPTQCPMCRERLRLSFRNERYYYPRACDQCKKPIISVYDPLRTKNVYCHSCWWSDQWNPRDFGREFDFSRPFFEQYGELFDDMPKLSMQNDDGVGSQNCEYTNDFAYGKNCYLVVASWHDHDCMYGFQINHDKDCVDNYFVNDSELMHNSLFCEKCYACQDCMQCADSTNCIFGFDLKGCNDCLFSAGLRHKKYYIWNQPYTKEEFFKKKEELKLGSHKNRERYRAQFEKFLLTIPRKYADIVKCEDCTGDHIANSKNAKECFVYRDMRDCKWITAGYNAKDCYECYSTSGSELCYANITPDNAYRALFTIHCWKSRDIQYSENCHSSHDMFGCIGFKRGKFCILNKEYEKDEYHALRKKIIEHMGNTYGEFFPAELSPFAYNETTAHEWHPLDQMAAEKLGYRWQNTLPGSFGKETISFDRVPDSIEEAPSDIWKEIFPCIKCGKSFKILERELEFYKRFEIPLPRICVDCRFYARKARMNPRKLYERACMNTGCSNKFLTTYAPDRPEKIYCETCYTKVIL